MAQFVVGKVLYGLVEWLGENWGLHSVNRGPLDLRTGRMVDK